MCSIMLHCTGAPILLQTHTWVCTGSSALSSFPSQLSNKAERLQGDYISICQKKDVCLMSNGLLKREWPFFPPLTIYVSFFRVHAVDFSHNGLLASNAARISIQKTASRIYKYWFVAICHSRKCRNILSSVVILRLQWWACVGTMEQIASLLQDQKIWKKKPNSEKKSLMRYWHVIHLMAGKKIKRKNNLGLFIVSLNSSLLFKCFVCSLYSLMSYVWDSSML